MAVADDLACSEDRRCKLGAVHDHVETTLEQADQVHTGIALHAARGFVGRLELLFGNVAVIALQLLLGAQLQTKVGNLALAALTVLAGAIRTLVDGRIWTTPDVFAHPAVEFVLGACALRHKSLPYISWTAQLAAIQPGIAPPWRNP